ncbi:Plasmodium exported protein, unknown function [Plasmodium relictum]|uniref:Uncharacterized protein n=1 Tax=Plasmodium relictum TaxID=85471 RepID=A0A1J1GJW7_PLARL|nr:Plasmodium exported protein, unknown function [Plasmodium relictum]CRG84153.1 Plasmodium exported protein, unknown function [Plasmodium relictum]
MDIKYILKDKFDLRIARSLAEGREIIKSIDVESKINLSDVMKERYLEQDIIKTNSPIEIEKICSETDTELLQEKVKEKKINKNLLYRNALRKISLFSVVILPIIFIVTEIFLTSDEVQSLKRDSLLISLYLMLCSFFIIHL